MTSLMGILESLPRSQRILLFIFFLVLIGGLFAYYIYIPMSERIASLDTEISQVRGEIARNQAKVVRLPELKRENAQLEARLKRLSDQLPSEAEVETLLKQVSDLGIRSGLDFRLYRPVGKKENTTGLYSEVPVDVEVAGGYHAVASFFDQISKLPRIVNVSSLRMVNPTVDKGKFSIQTTFVATAFAVPDSPPKEGSGEKIKDKTGEKE